MDNYIIILGLYIGLMLLAKASDLLTNHYQNVTKQKEKDAFNRRAYHIENQRVKRMHVQRSSKDLPPANEYDAISIEEMDNANFNNEMPFEAWLAVVEHQYFMDCLEIELENQGIVTEDI